jgi:hypothetical protein
MQKTKISTATKIYAFCSPLFLQKLGITFAKIVFFAVSFAGHVGGAIQSPNPGSTSVSSSRAASGDTRSLHCKENPIHVFPEMKLRGLIPNLYILVSLSDLFIPKIGLPIWLQQNRQTDHWNILIAHRYMNVEIGKQTL